jgi:hypothetical protein
MIVRGTIGLSFENATAPQRLRLKTESNSIYSIELFSGAMQSQKLDGETFTMRRGNVIINGRRYSNVSIGYNPARGVLLVADSADGHVIRQSTGITDNESTTG